MRVAIVNDLRIAVEALRRVVTTVPGYEVAWVALDGAEAVSKCAADTPDLVLMDLIMPVMDGVEATKRIMRESPCAVLVVTATVSGNAAKVFAAMGCGALDAVQTPSLGPAGRIEGGEALLRKMALLASLVGREERRGSAGEAALPAPAPTGAAPLVAIGASTGGPKAVAELLAALPADLPAAIVIVQHVDVEFAPALATWLADQSQRVVRLVRPGDTPTAGTVLLGGTNDHLVFRANRALDYTPEPATCPYRPSVDAFFRSAAAHWPYVGLAALLTGMGRDGAEGLLELRRAGWETIAQDKASSVLFGMPKAAAEIGAASRILPLDQIPAAIEEFVSRAPTTLPGTPGRTPPR